VYLYPVPEFPRLFDVFDLPLAAASAQAG